MKGKGRMKYIKTIGAVTAMIACVAFADDADIVTVKGRGVGVNENAALKDAYRDAVETAVGLYVDAEQLMKNDEVIKDQILTQSNAYVEGYKVLEKSENNGVTSIKIQAKVRKQLLTKRIEGCMPAKITTVGSQLANMYAQSVTCGNRNKDAAAIFSKALEELGKLKLLYEAELVSTVGKPVRQGNERDETVIEMDYFFKLFVNKKRYFDEVVPRLDEILSRLSLEAPKTIRCSCEINRSADKKAMLSYIETSDGSTNEGRKFEKFTLKTGVSGHHIVEAFMDGRKEPLPVVLITQANDALTVVRGKKYMLDPSCAAVYSQWAKKGDIDGFRSIPERMDLPKFVVDFQDGNGQALTESEISFSHNFGGPYARQMLQSLTLEGIRGCFWLISPWMGGDSAMYGKWIRFKIAKDDLPKIKSIKVEVAN